MKRLLAFAGVALALVAGICLIRVWSLPAPPAPGAAAPTLALDEAGAVQRLAASLRIRTISFEDRAQIDPAAQAAFAEHLRRSFPRVHQALHREAVGPSLLYTWAGRDPAGPPILLLAHMDVVPVEPGTEKQWTHPPFDGVVADGFVWGRGARDDKSSVLALLEAAEVLLAAGYQPPRTIYLAFGHDEEIGGQAGAKRIAALLQSRGVRAEFLLDEGSAVLDGLVPGVNRRVASINAAEKGYFTVRLTTRQEGGHSSRPPRQTAVGRLARAVARVQEQPMPARLERPVTDMLDRVAPEMDFGARLALANRWLFGRMLLRKFAQSPTTDALIRTTTAPTVIHAGIKDNVLPSEATALINFRLLPGDRIEDVVAHVRAAINDPAVEIAPGSDFNSEASPPAPLDNAAFRLLERTALEIYPDALVSTGLVIGATDARNYAGVYEARYNFSPGVLKAEDLPTIHGTNERIAVENYLGMIRFYAQLLRNWAAGPGPA
jgi:carboxypeptidase PM20D1